MFADQLQTRIRWYKGQDLLAWQRELALEYLQREDYIRSVIFALEGFETSLIDLGNDEDIWNFDHREKAVEEYWNGLRGNQELKQDYVFLNGLRNILAHGTRPKDNKLGKELGRIVSDCKLLRNKLQTLIKKLLFKRG